MATATIHLTLEDLNYAIRRIDSDPRKNGHWDAVRYRMLRAYAETKARTLPAGPITKWDALHPIDQAEFDATPFRVDGEERSCSGCGTPLPTEGAFARHYIVTDRRYLNLGYCPVRLAKEHQS